MHSVRMRSVNCEHVRLSAAAKMADQQSTLSPLTSSEPMSDLDVVSSSEESGCSSNSSLRFSDGDCGATQGTSKRVRGESQIVSCT